MPSFWSETGEITSPASTGNQSYNFTGAGNGLVPKAIIFFASFKSAGSTGADDHRMFGFTTGSTAARNQCHCWQNNDGVGTQNMTVGFSETSCIFKNDDNATTTDLAAVLVSFDTDGFTLNWTTTAAGVAIQYVAIGGDDLSVFADNFDTGTGTGNIAETGVGFQPKAAIFVWSRLATTAGSFVSADANFGIGVATSSTADWVWESAGDDGATVNEFYGDLCDNNCIKTLTASTGTVDSEFALVSFDSDGFTIDPLNAPAASLTVSYLCIGGANINVAAGTETAPTSVTTKATNVGFEPQLVMLAGFNTTAVVNNSGYTAGDRAASFGFGIPSADSRCCFWIEDNASDPIDCNGGTSATKCISIRSPTAIGTVSAEADIDASTSTEFVLNWTTAGTAFIFGYLAIGGTTAALELAADAGSYTVTGQTAGTQYGRVVAANAGSYAVTGQNATLSKGLTLLADAGSYAVTGQDVTFNRTYVADANAGSYAVTGQTAALEHDKQIIADGGSYAVTGQDAVLAKGLSLSAEAGSYAVTGQDATFNRTYAVDAGAGSYAVTGQNATFDRTYVLDAGVGSYAVTGSDAALEYTPAGTWNCPAGVTFDGTNDYLTRGADLTGSANNSRGTCCFWVKFAAAGDGVRQRILNAGNAAVIIERTAANRFQVFVVDSTGAISATLGGAVNRTSAGGWMSVLMSWDTNFTAGNKLMSIWVNDADDSGVKTDAGAAFDVDYTATDWGVGARPSDGANKLNGDLADFWFAQGVYFDFSVEANRRKFIHASGGAVSLGADGSTPTGTAPIVYLRGPATGFETNRGSGGDFTVTGALADSGTNPPCGAEVVAEAGSYAVTGQTAALNLGRAVAAEAGSYAVTGQDATFNRTYAVDAGAGSYSVTGQDATFDRTYVLNTEAGSYVVTGSDAALEFDRQLIAGAGSYAVTGSDADLYFNRLIEANAGGYVITGFDAGLELGRILSAEAGSYLVTGSDVTLTITAASVPGLADIENTIAGAAITGSAPGSSISASSGGASVSGSKPGAGISGSVGGATIQ
jgi:hypothetical protein